MLSVHVVPLNFFGTLCFDAEVINEKHCYFESKKFYILLGQ